MGRVYGLYYGQNTSAEFLAGVKPYLYGYPTEVKMQYDLTSIPIKHYTLGRVAVELVRGASGGSRCPTGPLWPRLQLPEQQACPAATPPHTDRQLSKRTRR